MNAEEAINNVGYLHAKRFDSKVASLIVEELRKQTSNRSHQYDIQLCEEVATPIAEEARKRIGRDSTSDDDEEFFKLEQKLYEEALRYLEMGIGYKDHASPSI
jgi:hypothetical protein